MRFIQWFTIYILVLLSIQGIAQVGSGGTITQISVDGYVYYVHTFSTSGTFVPPSGVSQVEYLVVGGGGGGGGFSASQSVGGGGGGGAGGYLTNLGGSAFTVIPNQSYTVTVGAGGDPGSLNIPGGTGGYSSFGSVIADGGGGGASQGDDNGGDGASGGGARLAGVGGAGIAGQGFGGGDGAGGLATTAAAGGGGGAFGVGSDGVASTGGAGGAGLASMIAGSSVTYAAGGAGGGYGTGADGTDASDNTGNGATGAVGSSTGSIQIGGRGGSGIVVIRYKATMPYRSKQSGDWNQISTWEQYTGGNWVDATSYPATADYFYPVVESFSTYQIANNSSNHTINLPSEVQSGDLLILIFRAGGTTSVLNPPNGFVEIGHRANSGNTYIWYKRAEAQESNPVVTTSSGTRATALLYRISGWGGVPEVEETLANINNPPEISPSWGAIPALYLAVLTNRRSDSNVTAAPSSFTDLETISQSSSTQTSRTRISLAELNSSGTVDPSPFTTIGTIDNPHSFTIAIRPAPPAPVSATIMPGHTVTVTANQSTDEVVVNGTGVLKVNPSVNFTLSENSTLNVLDAGILSLEGNLTGLGNLTMSTGSTLEVYSLVGLSASGTSGNVQISGTRNYGTAANYIFKGSGSQQSTGNGLTTVNDIVVNCSNGLLIQTPISISGNLDLQNGVVSSSGNNVFTIENTASNAIQVSGPGSYISGPMVWRVIEDESYTFPLGKGGLEFPFSISSISGTNLYIKAEAFNANSGGTVASSIVSKSTTEYWSASIVSGTLTNASVSLTRSATLGNYDVIARSSTVNGQYQSLLGSVSGNSIVNSSGTGSSLGFFLMAEGKKITTGTINPISYCPSSSVSVPYTISHTALSGNVFTAQLSDENGSFSSPVNIGTRTATNSGTITASIPPGTPSGSGYRIRVIGSNPLIGGSPNGVDLTIVNNMTPPSAIGEFICIGSANVSVTIRASGAASVDRYRWYNAAISGTILKTSTNSNDSTYVTNLSGPTSFWVSKLSDQGCESGLTQVLAGYPPASLMDQDSAGVDNWVGHIYDGTNFDTYYGYYTKTETFDESFSGNAACFNFTGDTETRSINSETFSIRYLMNSTRRGLYTITLGANDGSSLSVDDNIVHDYWTAHNYTAYNNVLFALNGNSNLMYEYYDNTTANRVTFNNLTLLLENTLDQNITQTLTLGEQGQTISGDVYGALPSGIQISGSGYQWSYSTTPNGSRTLIYGAIDPTFTPDTDNPPFNVAGTYYVRRNGVLLSNNNYDPSPAYATCESNVAIISVQPPLLDVYRSISSGDWDDPNTWEQLYSNQTWSISGNYPQALSPYTIFPQIVGTATSAKTNEINLVHTVTLPEGIESGDLILIFWSDASRKNTQPDLPGYTELKSSFASNSYRKIYYRIADGTEGASVSTSNTIDERSAHVSYRIAKGTYSGNPSASNEDAGSDNSPNPPELPGGGTFKFLWFASVHTQEIGNYTLPNNYESVSESRTSATTSSDARHCQMITVYRTNEASSENPSAFSLSGWAVHAAYTVAVKGVQIIPKSYATVRAGDTVSVASSQAVDTVIVASGGVLTVKDGVNLTLAENTQIQVNSGGTLHFEPIGWNSGSGNLILNTGSTLVIGNENGVYSSAINGNIRNTGTRTYAAGTHFIYEGTSAQLSGDALSQNSPGNLTIQNSDGLTLSVPVTMSGTLYLNQGIITTATDKLLSISNTSPSAISGGSASSFVNGPLLRSLPANQSGSSVYSYPVGAGTTYLPFELVNPTTGNGSSSIQVQAFASAPGGSADASLVSVANTEYWSVTKNGFFTNASVSISRPGALLPLDAIAGSTAQDGTYINLNGTIGSTSITESDAIGSNAFFQFGRRKFIWDGSSDTDWFTAANWNTNLVPNENSTIVIPSTANQPLISGAENVTISLSEYGSLSIENTATLSLAAGPLLQFPSGTSVTTSGTGRIVLQPAARYVNLSASTPLLETQQLIDGIKGWRNIASPVRTSYSDLFDSLVTQNFTGSNYPLLQPNLLWWDETNIGTTLQGWRQPSDIADSIPFGRGHFHYVFDGAGILSPTGDPTGNFYADELPVIISAIGKEANLFSGSFSFSPFTFTPRDDDSTAQISPGDTTYVDINVSDEGWNLIGNPTASTLDWDEVSGWTKTNIDATIYIWDPNTNSGEYLTWNGSVGPLDDGLISPFQAFWVLANADNPVLSVNNNAKTTSTSSFYGKSNSTESMVVAIELEALGMKTKSFLSFDSQGVNGKDKRDAYRLEPMTDTWLALYMNSGLNHSMPLVINNLNANIGDEIHIPLYTGAMQENRLKGGSFKLSWEIPLEWPLDKELLLMDHLLKKAIRMSEIGSYSFTQNENDFNKLAVVDPLALPARLISPKLLPEGNDLKATQIQRFTIVIQDKSDDPEPDYRPSEPLILDPAPNPFSHQLVIRFRLPIESEVYVGLYDQFGRLLAVPVSGNFAAGLTELEWVPEHLKNGMYFLKFICGETISTKRIIYLN